MPITRIQQQTDECLPCCIAMVLNLSRETVVSWFEGREYDKMAVVEQVLAEKGYEVEKFDAPGKAGDLRRIVCLANQKGEGHVVVMDEDNLTIVDPGSKATNLFEMQVLGYSTRGAGGTFVIRAKNQK
jgi:ABC-type bacteriocin/lantibiotic exporter with double-glycine peptidase domain